jgi:hypothetical protein
MGQTSILSGKHLQNSTFLYQINTNLYQITVFLHYLLTFLCKSWHFFAQIWDFFAREMTQICTDFRILWHHFWHKYVPEMTQIDTNMCPKRAFYDTNMCKKWVIWARKEQSFTRNYNNLSLFFTKSGGNLHLFWEKLEQSEPFSQVLWQKLEQSEPFHNNSCFIFVEGLPLLQEITTIWAFLTQYWTTIMDFSNIYCLKFVGGSSLRYYLVPNGEGKPSFQSEKKQKSISLREIFICLTIALLGQAPDPRWQKSK